MKTDVQKYLQHCLPCQLKKLKRVKTRQPMKMTDTPEAAFDKVSMDIVGPLPVTRKGYQHILTIQDLLTKYCLAIPLKRATSENIAKALVNRLICVFEAPEAVLSDQGANLCSELITKMARMFRIKQYRTSAFHPQSNGSLERSHHSLVEYLKQFISEEEDGTSG